MYRWALRTGIAANIVGSLFFIFGHTKATIGCLGVALSAAFVCLAYHGRP